MKPAYYNEIDKYAAAWLRNLIAAGHIAPGDVDERSIEDVRPDDLRGYVQCHFFAGIGVWSLALRRAGWADDRPIWTASCPCQPFSSAGAGAGFADERHLWPALFHLASQCRPAILVGEQVASKDADPWLDLVQTDMEALGYAFGAVAFPSAGVGAPHIRDRTYWTAVSRDQGDLVPDRNVQLDRVANANSEQRPGWERAVGALDETRGWEQGAAAIAGFCGAGGLADLHGERCGEARQRELPTGCAERAECGGDAGERPGPTNGYWRNADWLACRDGKWRPVEPGTFPLAHGAASRVGRLRAYGNAVNAEAARAWVETVMGAL